MKRMERVVATQARLISFLLCILGALFLTHLIKGPDFNDPQIYVLFLLFFSIGLWVSEAVPPFATGIMIIGFLVFALGAEEIEGDYGIDVMAYVNTWSDSVIWLLLGGFFLAQAMTNTGLDLKMFDFATKRFGSSPSKLLIGLMLSTAIASMFISNTATTAMVFAALTPLFAKADELPHFSKALILGIPAAASVGGMGTLIGSPPNAVAADMINNTSETVTIGFLEWFYLGAPVAIALVVILWQALKWKYPLKNDKIDLDLLIPEELQTDDQEVYTNRKLQRRIVMIVLGVTVLLWLTERVHKIPIAAVSGIPIIALTMVGIVNSNDVRKLPWDTLMLVAGGLSLGLALQHTGLSEYFVAMLGGIRIAPILIILIFALVTVVLSNIMSNTAAVSILVPASVIMTAVNSDALTMVIGLCASCALFLPISTPPNAIAYSTGLIQQKEFRFGGIIAGLLGPLLVILWMFFLISS